MCEKFLNTRIGKWFLNRAQYFKWGKENQKLCQRVSFFSSLDIIKGKGKIRGEKVHLINPMKNTSEIHKEFLPLKKKGNPKENYLLSNMKTSSLLQSH